MAGGPIYTGNKLLISQTDYSHALLKIIQTTSSVSEKLCTKLLSFQGCRLAIGPNRKLFAAHQPGAASQLMNS